MSLRIVPTIGGPLLSDHGNKTNNMKHDEANATLVQQPYEVQWSLPVPEITTTASTMMTTATTAVVSKSRFGPNKPKKRAVTIHFQHVGRGGTLATMPEPRVIKATVSGCPTTLDQTWLLCNLFPNDCPDGNHGYYRWCHYLAGIHLVSALPAKTTTTTKPTRLPQTHPLEEAAGGAIPFSATAPTMTTSTRTIIHTLQRRIRANATLKYILHSLCQHHKIPTIPFCHNSTTATSPASSAVNHDDATISRSPASWQIAFTQEQQQQDVTINKASSFSSSLFTYNVYCKKSLAPNHHTLELRARVEIDKAQYPSVPPRWTLFPDPPGSSAPAMYNVTWNLLEQLVNHDMLLSPSHPATTQHRAATPQTLAAASLFAAAAANAEPKDDEETAVPTSKPKDRVDEIESEDSLMFAEWILVHQLNKLLEKWEQVETSTTGVRSVRGRDRVPLSLYEPNHQSSPM